MSAEPRIDVVGANANNLRDIDVCFPWRGVTALVGVSGSGKSSLLGDTLGAEAARRSALFLRFRTPGLEEGHPWAFISAIPPTIHVGQRAFRATSRTTVGTATGFLATLRRLFVAGAQPWADDVGRPVFAPTPAVIADWLLAHYRGDVTIWAVPVRFEATDGTAAAQRLSDAGISKAVVRSETDPPARWASGRTVETARFRPLSPEVRHIIEAEIARIEVSDRTDRAQLLAALETAFHGGSATVVETPAASQVELLGPFGPRIDTALHCLDPDSPAVYRQPDAHLLSFNAPDHPESGACPACRGLGQARVLDESALVRDPTRSMHAGAFALHTPKGYKYVNIQHETIEGLRGLREFDPDRPWKDLGADARQLILEGSDGVEITDRELNGGRKLGPPRSFLGFRRAILDRTVAVGRRAGQLSFLAKESTCPACGGTRWSSAARALRLGGLALADILGRPFGELTGHLEGDGPLERSVDPPVRPLVQALRRQVQAFGQVGLNHLAADRGMLTLSDGERRRLAVAGVLESRCQGLCLLLDEPARGLHAADIGTLAGALRRLGRNHTVIVSEHRDALVRAADHVIALGPRAGAAGGEVVGDGSPEQVWRTSEPVRRDPLPIEPATMLSIRGGRLHNLSGDAVTVPLGRLSCITGVSGSGKTSFVRGVLVPAIAANLRVPPNLHGFELRQGAWDEVVGDDSINGLVALDRQMPPPNRRSLIATALDVADGLRTAFAATSAARSASLGPGDFSTNAGTGRCHHCTGLGEVEDGGIWVPCSLCGGTRFEPHVLSIRVDGLNIAELLDTPVAALCDVPVVSRFRGLIRLMDDLGIGHLSLGRRMDTLSGGEVQRVRIAESLAADSAGGILYVLDEPTVGLHPEDVRRFMSAIDRVLDGGRNTVVLVEHNLDVIAAADWIVDFGPGGGPDGGRVVASGTPAEIRDQTTLTGRALAGESLGTDAGEPRDEQAPEPVGPVSRTEAERVIAQVRRLLGEDIAPAAEPVPGAPLDRPAALPAPADLQGRRAWEIAGLDLELARLLLDMGGFSEPHRCAQEVTATWGDHPDARLVVHPALDLLQEWGPAVPLSLRSDLEHRLSVLGLELLSDALDWRRMRAAGKRFQPASPTAEARRRCVDDALAIGGGYAELLDDGGASLAVAAQRPVDLEVGLVGPRTTLPVHCVRHDRLGRCPMCGGSRVVEVVDDALIIGDPRQAPTDERFLTAEAAEVTKGMRRNELVPFFRRLGDEGRWDTGRPYADLAVDEQNLLRFGFWSRPGHGTFLKARGANPSEVGSWLRWDGLYRHLLPQVERSRHVAWKQAVFSSRQALTCPACDGTGLSTTARLLVLANTSLLEWARDRRVNELVEALRTLSPVLERVRRSRDRLVSCLETAGAVPLAAPVSEPLARAIFGAAAEAFVGLTVATS